MALQTLLFAILLFVELVSVVYVASPNGTPPHVKLLHIVWDLATYSHTVLLGYLTCFGIYASLEMHLVRKTFHCS